MIKITLKQLTEWIACDIDPQYLDVEIHGVTIDSRKIQPGQLFIPFKGENVDGHQYCAQALKDGANATFFQQDAATTPPESGPVIYVKDTLVALQQLAQAYLQYVAPTVIAVTGSNGKTTTKDMLENVLSAQYRVQKTQGNYNNEIGMPLTILELDVNTEVSILEMGMSGFHEIELLTNIARPDFAIITNIGESHMQDLGSRAGIAQAKFEIVSGLKDTGYLIYDGDEPLLQPHVATLDTTHVISVGLGAANDMQCKMIAHDETGMTFTINDEATYTLPILGEHNIRNATIAITVAQLLGLDQAIIQQQLSQLQLTAMRMQKFTTANGAIVINDAYNASPTSMKAAIDTLELMPGDKILVLGDVLELGEHSEQLHTSIGAYLEGKTIDQLYTYGDNAKAIHDKGKRFVREAIHFDTKPDMIRHLTSVVKANHAVLVKASRGMRLEEVVDALVQSEV
ncbi:UDP-N-acetylmuramoyl-tripeptide--D-alanyl-D-alanine ligase [Staphylococcus lutrae]|uniref:UDP-N-acetylmuramoyl-tripeptide--D-alanyl-D-alanine ligase n=1 Tax=Staphylococcus lutrae TaxID=155085 RepID=A0AAC9RR96_9STAP|nr:UDP-N-acetylmuramoyl-tripeptide--D-alanyl-D-alanine ligase [Staphylococcus lutrae]ARJ50246.1 UDP-N-acetylmuramoylalanyl-D-glutamyl-2, 6-diaminopimelate--D-alanyl-D-alanine ligase [Staphylococcus lutrae]PNZ36302.1 UDP-N-acetylmuramoyl-tripeptide--D-alanyl-D-alanine ligase [Staphylococcus lutrae]